MPNQMVTLFTSEQLLLPLTSSTLNRFLFLKLNFLDIAAGQPSCGCTCTTFSFTAEGCTETFIVNVIHRGLYRLVTSYLLQLSVYIILYYVLDCLSNKFHPEMPPAPQFRTLIPRMPDDQRLKSHHDPDLVRYHIPS